MMEKVIPKSGISYMSETITILDEITGMQTIERTLHLIVKYLSDNLKCQTCAIIQLNPKTEYIEIANSYGLSWGFCKKYRNRIPSDTIHDLMWGRKDMIVLNSRDNEELAKELKLENDFASCIAVGLTASHRPLGYLYVDSENESHFRHDERLLVALHSRVISLALLKNRLLNDIQKMAIEDEDTGVIKYSYFYGRLQSTLSRSQRLNENLALVLLDIAKFDTILSSYGIQVTKALMHDLIALLKNHIRNYDGLSKFGTDEVIISLPGSSGVDALSCTQKLYQLLRKTKFTKHKLSIDVSIGIASYPENAKELSGLLTATKNALIDAKRDLNEKIVLSESFFI
jgi:diguanylate cyclase (GGDEF)-like protein